MPIDLENLALPENQPVKAEIYYPAILRNLAEQLGVGNDFYFPLRGAAVLLENP
jgi:hypothetical protein